jgi:hypothetical protein
MKFQFSYSLFKPALLIFISIALTTPFLSCNSQKKGKVSLQTWIDDKETYDNFLEYNGFNGSEIKCDSIKVIADRLKLEEFKSKTYSSLADCALKKGNNEKVKEYLLKNVRSGLHPDRIDSTKYSSVYYEIRPQMYKLHFDFWNGRDTTYFSALEERVIKEQTANIATIYDPSPENINVRDSIFLDNTKYLLEYINENGFPFRPTPSYFNFFRKDIDPSIIAMHTKGRDKIKLLEFAIEGAKEGKVSWYTPVSICISFHSNDIPQEDVKPLYFLYFDENDSLDLENSYLQLYSLEQLYNQEMNANISIQPSKHNNTSKTIIENQLLELKQILVNEFSFASNSITLSEVPSEEEEDLRIMKNYDYTLTILNR